MKQMIGQTFGKLTVVESLGSKNKKTIWRCHCERGNKDFVVTRGDLTTGHTKACGCVKKKHGYSKSGTYVSWYHMLSRCQNTKRKDWHHYGGRGISVCASWEKDFMVFLKDMGTKPEGMTLDRINNDGNYEPSNCRWATREQQSRNNRTNKLDIHKANRIREFLWAGISRLELARFYGVSKSSIDQIVWDKIWKAPVTG